MDDLILTRTGGQPEPREPGDPVLDRQYMNEDGLISSPRMDAIAAAGPAPAYGSRFNRLDLEDAWLASLSQEDRAAVLAEHPDPDWELDPDYTPEIDLFARMRDVAPEPASELEPVVAAEAEPDEPYPLLSVVSVGDVMRTGATKPVMLVTDLLVRGAHHTAYGPKESGKTFVMLGAIVKPLLLAEQAVIYADMEMSRQDIADRLHDLGVPPEIVDQYFVYLELPTLDGSAESKRQWIALLDEKQPVLALADAQAGVLADAQLNENLTSDVLKWLGWYFTPARKRGATTLMLDHVGHDVSVDRARGASGKGAASKVELQFEKTESFDRETVGKVTVTRRKNTLAAPIPSVQRYRIGGSPDGFVFERDESEDVFAAMEDEGGAKWLAILDEVEAGILESGTQGTTTTGLRQVLDMRPGTITKACIALVEDESRPVERKAGSRAGSWIYFVTAASVPRSAKADTGTERNASKAGTGTEGNGTGTGERKPTRKRIKPYHVPDE